MKKQDAIAIIWDLKKDLKPYCTSVEKYNETLTNLGYLENYINNIQR